MGKGRRTWCSQDCVDEFRAQNEWAFVRRLVLKRDKGICVHCGFDAEKFNRIVRLVRQDEDIGFASYTHMEKWAKPLGFNYLFFDQWQADHILPRIRGGTDDLDNLRTLCVPCHKIETKRLAGELAKERREEKQKKQGQKPLF